MGIGVAGRHDSDGLQQGVLLFSLEMPKEQIVRRAVSMVGRVPLYHLKEPQRLSQAEWSRVTEASVALATMPLSLDDAGGQTIFQLRAKIRQVRSEMASRKNPARLRLVIVDYIQLLRGSTHSDNREAVVSEVMRALKAISLSERVHILALSQLNRDVEKRSNKRGTMSDLRESGEIENSSDNVAFLYREDYYAKKSWRGQSPFQPTGEAELDWVKQRDGQTGTMPLRFEDLYTRFYEDESDSSRDF
jgi:replicative DNA helicase